MKAAVLSCEVSLSLSEIEFRKMTRFVQVAIEEVFEEFGIDHEFEMIEITADSPEENTIGGFRSEDPDTSRKGAIDAYPRTGSHKSKILIALYKAGDRGLTYEEIEEKTGIKNAHKRVSDLKNGSWVYDEGEREAKLTGSMVAIHRITGRAQRFVEIKEKASVLA